MKKLIQKMVLTLPILAMAISPLQASAAAADRFNMSDTTGHWAEENLLMYTYADILRGVQENGEYKALPDRDITRGEFVTLLIRAFGFKAQQGATAFTDVKATDYFAEPVRIASSLQIVAGYEGGTFQPGKKIRRDEIAAMVMRAVEYEKSIDLTQGQPIAFSDVGNYWGKDAIQKASRVGIVNGVGNNKFGPEQLATRAQAITMIANALNQQVSDIPSDSELIDTVMNAATGQHRLITESDVDGLRSHANTYFAGLYEGVEEDSILEFESFFNEGFAMDYYFTGTPEAVVLEKTNRFAVVELMNAEITTIAYYQGLSHPGSADSSGYYLLKKDHETNTWKIFYSNLPNAAQ